MVEAITDLLQINAYLKTGGVNMAKKKDKKAKGRMDASKDLSPDIRNSSSDNCASDGPCKSNRCK